MTNAQRRAIDAVQSYWRRAISHWPQLRGQPTVSFKLRGRAAGTASTRMRVRLNAELLERYPEEMLAQTVPHEVAHLVTFQVYPGASAHGPEWRSVMHFFGCSPDRTHTMETTPARVVPRPHVYACNCREHRLTERMHKSIRSGRGRRCRACKSTLAYCETSRD